MYRIYPLFFFVCGVFGQISLKGECDYATTNYTETVNLTQMYGTWHQISRIGNKMEIGDCSTLTISKPEGSGDTLFSHSEVFNKTELTMNGTIGELEDSPGWLLMKFSDFSLNFVMLSTKVPGVAVIYSCHAFQNSTKQVWAWQYNRNATLSSEERDTLDQIITSQPDLKDAAWRETNHTSTVCGNAGVRLPTPQVLTVLALVFLAKEFV
ncbi:apolipoprotein D-like [Epargyreus clarus]|uniref:apolipoprotein D-like n=1 Tax=Epargyreus clarus TaxID=520877 RepID=UPI003C2FD350